jgi:DNA/RNA endonuclease G (NUC1)
MDALMQGTTILYRYFFVHCTVPAPHQRRQTVSSDFNRLESTGLVPSPTSFFTLLSYCPMIRSLRTALVTPFRRGDTAAKGRRLRHLYVVMRSTIPIPKHHAPVLNLLAVSCVVTYSIVYCHIHGHDHEGETTKNESSSSSSGSSYSPTTKLPLVQKSPSSEGWQSRQQYDHQLLSPVLPIRIFRPNPNLEIAFDVRTRNPVYALERLVVVDDENGAASKNNTISSGKYENGQDENDEYTDDDEDENETEGDGTTSSSLTKRLFGREQQQQQQRTRRRPRFYEEKRLPEAYRSRNSHFHKSGYDRGHLAPAADFRQRHSSSPQPVDDHEYYYDTFNLCNVSPQHPDLNRSTLVYLESWTRQVAATSRAKNKTAETYVLTGPLWLPRQQLSDKVFEYSHHAIGTAPSLVAVPTHFFKVVVVTVACNSSDDDDDSTTCTDDGRRISDFACFVMPNGPKHPKQQQQLLDFLVSWTDLETVSGLQFFPLWTTNTSIRSSTRTHQVVYDWKRVADALTAQQQQQQRRPGHDETPLLLLTDGKCTNTTSSTTTPNSKALPRGGGNNRVDSISTRSSVEHLCRDGKCLRSKR